MHITAAGGKITVEFTQAEAGKLAAELLWSIHDSDDASEELRAGLAEALKPGPSRFPPPTHPYAGSDSARQSAGDPGHCEECARYGHIMAHPDLGCADVGCDREHGPEPAGVTQRGQAWMVTPEFPAGRLVIVFAPDSRADLYHPGFLPPGTHTHTREHQSLTHAHPGGNWAHSYYGHPENPS